MEPFDPQKLILIHGLDGSSQGEKAILLRTIFPRILTPDFAGSVAERMKILETLMGVAPGWTIIGSSLGGLMGALFTTRKPAQVRKLILLAPALFLPEFVDAHPQPVDTPTTVIHGTLDTIVPLAQTRFLAENIFLNLNFIEVEDDHRLSKTVHQLDWKKMII